MQHSVLTPDALARALHLRDLTDPLQGAHAMQHIVDLLHESLARRWRCRRRLHRVSPLVTVDDNYDRLGYPPDGAARDARYTRYVTRRTLLRTQTSAVVPGLLRSLALDPPGDVLLVCPGLVYRRDAIDRLHTGEPHQVDLWRVKRGRLDPGDLRDMIRTVVAAALPGHRHRVAAADHPYTIGGLQVDVEAGGTSAGHTSAGRTWVEIGECGMAAPAILEAAGHDPAQTTGLAMGLGLDRILMVRKGVGDIRLLRAEDPRIARQMLDLDPYVPVSDQPPIRRDLSIAAPQDASAEEIGGRIRAALGDRLDQLESADVLAQTPYEDLPAAAHERMGLGPGQKNVLLRLVIRHPVRTLTRGEANELRDLVYRAVHQGSRMEWAAP